MNFINPTDPIVAQLLFELGNVNALDLDIKNALEVYKLAEIYGYKSELFDLRQSHFQSMQKKADLLNEADTYKREKPADFKILVIAAFAFVAFIIFFVIRRIRKIKK